MPLTTNPRTMDDGVELVSPTSGNAPAGPDLLRARASGLSHELVLIPGVHSSDYLSDRWRALADCFRPWTGSLHASRHTAFPPEDVKPLYENLGLLSTELRNTGDVLRSFSGLPQVRTETETPAPRIMVIAEDLLAAAGYQFSDLAFSQYLDAFQDHQALTVAELWALVTVLKLVLLERIVAQASAHTEGDAAEGLIDVCIRSLRDVTYTSWNEIIEPLILFDRILRQDPTGDYARMDFESRDLYRKTVLDIAEHSGITERDVAQAALDLAREFQSKTNDPSRDANRCSHIGYYLLAEGASYLRKKVGCRPSFGQSIRAIVKRYPDEFYLPAIAAVTIGMMALLTLYVTPPESSPWLALTAMLALLLPCSESAVQLMNYVTTSLLQPQILPKLDFEAGIPDSCMTLVAVPTLLLNEKQVRRLVDDLEVRFLGNHDRNLHFALLSDLPDSHVPPKEDDWLVGLCSELITDLNQKYGGQGRGSFFLFHRHRVYDPREAVWMGWERKRGKLLQLNALLQRQSDSFPVKVGNLSILEQVRFVITLDADTELPRGSAQRMIGTLAHPLNQAIVDRERNIVVAGYGILQPRVRVSVQSARRSRLAKIYSGQTGLDIYTAAASDAYQDLYGEGTFAGKGIYEVGILHQVLDRRFPLNALLSHDLIEGAYARAGLVSDIEIVEDYPSHYSAYNRRKHRWLRGDWQIAEWLTDHVPAESGKRVPNPISLISQWKILDNLRRSLVEPATFLLLILGWTLLPGSPAKWTLAVLGIVLLPASCRFLIDLSRAVFKWKAGVVRDALNAWFGAAVGAFLGLTFLAHQMLLSGDAIVRVVVRKTLTGRRLLQWETAAQAESSGPQQSTLDLYLAFTPALSLGIGLLLWALLPRALPAALPILLLWASSKLLSVWLDLPPRNPQPRLLARDEVFLRGIALRTWRYFLEFSSEEHHWLVPDNVRERPDTVAARVSPTNIGLLLNARQAACRFGFITIPEFVDLTLHTLATVANLQRHRGHLLNWYDTRTLAPLPPRFVSSVDSGNLAASLWTLEQGSLEQLRQPILQPILAEGLLDYLRLLGNSQPFSRKPFLFVAGKLPREKNWLQCLLELPESVCQERGLFRTWRVGDADWLAEQARERLRKIKQLVEVFLPWQLPAFEELRDDPVLGPMMNAGNIALELMPEFISQLADCVESRAAMAKSPAVDLALQRLRERLPAAQCSVRKLIQDLRRIATESARFVEEMDFEFLLDNRRKLLSIGFSVEDQTLQSACYDLLASEARTALFVAIAKDDVPPESWFSLGRVQTLDHGYPILLSWSGTMFEYLMPSVWMQAYPDTLLERSRIGAVRAQRNFAAAHRIPWGISESAYSRTNPAGDYQYYAFGLPNLSLRKDKGEDEIEALVVSPYSTFLALPIDPSAAVGNLRRMHRLGWSGRFGFYEAADFSSETAAWRHHNVVRCWMAHHQGMSLLSIANVLQGGVVQHWFHAHPQVQATELLLQEKPVAYIRPAERGLPQPIASRRALSLRLRAKQLLFNPADRSRSVFGNTP